MIYCIYFYFNSCAMLLSNRVAGTSHLVTCDTHNLVFKYLNNVTPGHRRSFFNDGSKLFGGPSIHITLNSSNLFTGI